MTQFLHNGGAQWITYVAEAWFDAHGLVLIAGYALGIGTAVIYAVVKDITA